MKSVLWETLICLLICALCFTGCANQAGNTQSYDERFVSSQMGLYVELFQSSVLESKGENLLISPLSVQMALALAANGAAGQTREEMERVLGGSLQLEELNKYLSSYVSALPSEEKYKLEMANSIWMRDNEEQLKVRESFLKINQDYYKAQPYKAPFDEHTVTDINDWVKDNTDGMINKIIEHIDPEAMMYLINTVCFDAQWQTQYSEDNVQEGIFTAVSGEKRNVEMMNSLENKFISGRDAVGFIKNYAGGKYGFAALLPHQNIDIYDYVARLDAQSLVNTLKNVQDRPVRASIPKFSYEFDLKMNEILADIGMPTAFSNDADFSAMAETAAGDLSISKVLHKTYITVAEQGTRAGAVTAIEMTYGSAADDSPMVIELDRPFVFMIIDNASGLPLFMGVLADIQD